MTKLCKQKIMYQQSNNRSSIRGGNRRSFGPSRGGRFSRPSFSSRSRGNQRKVTNLIVNPALYIRKASPIITSADYTPHNSFEDFNLVEVLKQNIIHHGYTKPTPIQDQAITP